MGKQKESLDHLCQCIIGWNRMDVGTVKIEITVTNVRQLEKNVKFHPKLNLKHGKGWSKWQEKE